MEDSSASTSLKPEARSEVSGSRADGVAHGVEDDPAARGGDEDAVGVPGAAWRARRGQGRGGGRHARRGREELAAVESELADQLERVDVVVVHVSVLLQGVTETRRAVCAGSPCLTSEVECLRSVQDMAGDVAWAPSIGVQDPSRSTLVSTADRIRCTWSPSAKEGRGSVPSAMASMRSAAWWVKPCS